MQCLANCRALLAVLAVTASGAAHAGHGIGVVGYGAESLAMAGTDIAVASDSAAVTINPAGLTQIESGRFDVYISPFHTMRMKHSDTLGNRQLDDNSLGAPLAGSFALRLAAHPEFVLGAGFFAQGGTGMVYPDMKTPYGTRDELSAIIAISKIVVGAGWAVNEQLSLGANAGFFVGVARQKFFPDTSDAGAGFFGVRMDDGFGTSANISLGLRYEMTPELTFGLKYGSKADLPFKNATVTMNYESLGLGRVEYQDARLEGFAVSPSLGIGLAWQARPDLLIAFEYEWLDHSSALEATRLRAKNPDGPVPPGAETLDIRNTLGWRDQQVRSVAVAWQYSDKLVLRAGYDYVNNPIPPQHMTPLLNIIQGGEITSGFGRSFGAGWSFDFATQYQFKREARYNNPELPLGTSREVFECLSFTVALSRRW